MAKIEPSVGRVVWFYPDADSERAKDHKGPLAAQIAAVNRDGTLNLGVLDHLGVQFSAQNVPLVQDNMAVQQGVAHASWMPYQVGQAQKTEEAEKQAAVDLDSKIDHKVHAAVDARFGETLKSIEAKVADAIYAAVTPAPEPQKQGGT